MKKLEKLTLKEMNNEMVVISHNELPMLIGGGSDWGFTPAWAEELMETADNILDYGTSIVNDTANAVGNAASAVADGATQFYNEHEEGILVTANFALDVAAAILMRGASANVLDGLTYGQFGPGFDSNGNVKH